MSRATIPSARERTNGAAETPPDAADRDFPDLDLRGIRCPLSWARAKVRLEVLGSGEGLRLLVDDPKGARDIPRAAEAEGYAVTAAGEAADHWWILIQR